MRPAAGGGPAVRRPRAFDWTAAWAAKVQGIFGETKTKASADESSVKRGTSRARVVRMAPRTTFARVSRFARFASTRR